VPSVMSTATAVKITSAGEGALSQGDRSEVVQRAWRGMLQAHSCLAKRLDAELERAHRLPMTSYEVLHHLEHSSGGRMRMCDLAEQAHLRAAASPGWSTVWSARSCSSAAPANTTPAAPTPA